MIRYSKLIILLAIIVVTIVGMGCVRRDAGGVRKLVIWQQEDASVMPFIDGRMKAFEALYPGEIKVEQVHYDNEDLHQQYLTAAIAGAGPDLVMGPNDKAGIFAIGKFILPVEDLIDTKEFVPVAIEAITQDDHVWGVPVSTGNHLMLFYNTALAPNPPKTSDELVAMSKQIMKTHNGVYGFATQMGEPYFFIPFLTGFGGWVIDGSRPTLDTPQMIGALEYFMSLRDKDGITPHECDYNCMDGLFKEERAAFIVNGDWAINSYRDTLGKKFSIAVLPTVNQTGEPMRPMVGGKYLMINSRLKGEQLDWALKFAKFYTDNESQLIQFEKLGRIPGRMSSFKKAKAMSPDLLKPSFDQLALGKPSPMQVEMRAIWDTMRSQMGAFMSGRKSAAEAAKYMQKDATRKVEEMRIR